MRTGNRLVVVSNRLPVTLHNTPGECIVRVSSGGLATALTAALRGRQGIWVGWPGASDDAEAEWLVAAAACEHPYRLEPVFLSCEEANRFYLGFSNEIVWPLFHDLQSRCNFDTSYWEAYQRVNRKFAEKVVRVANHDDFIWVHDYHLTLLGKYLREMGAAGRMAFFQHIPFPPPDIFEKLPWREEVLDALLDFQLVGFQTARDRRNFIHCLQRLMDCEVHRVDDRFEVASRGRRTQVAEFPISIDFEEFQSLAATPEVAAKSDQLRRDLNGSQMVLGVDRLDYTKGIPERLKAFRHLLASFPDLHRRVTLVQVVVPSREDIPRYRELKLEIERLVSEINGQYTDSGWVPIHYIHRSLERTELVAYYRAADIALITPLKDGMNLIAKEFCAAQVEERGVLVLSEFAGAADELKRGALLVNPNDTETVARTIWQAYHMQGGERRQAMRRLRRYIRRYDVSRWTESFLQAAGVPRGEEQVAIVDNLAEMRAIVAAAD
jgi:alpha,alpha-trehalose-phosphate synthase [UDP-forming]